MKIINHKRIGNFKKKMLLKIRLITVYKDYSKILVVLAVYRFCASTRTTKLSVLILFIDGTAYFEKYCG